MRLHQSRRLHVLQSCTGHYCAQHCTWCADTFAPSTAEGKSRNASCACQLCTHHSRCPCPAQQTQQGALWRSAQHRTCTASCAGHAGATAPRSKRHATRPVLGHHCCPAISAAQAWRTGMQTQHGPAAMAACGPAQDSARELETAPAQQGWRGADYAGCTYRPHKASKTQLQLTIYTLLVWSLRSNTCMMMQSTPSGSITQSRHTFSQQTGYERRPGISSAVNTCMHPGMLSHTIPVPPNPASPFPSHSSNISTTEQQPAQLGLRAQHSTAA